MCIRDRGKVSGSGSGSGSGGSCGGSGSGFPSSTCVLCSVTALSSLMRVRGRRCIPCGLTFRARRGLRPRQWCDSITRDALCCALSVSYTHLRAHETVLDLVCRLLLEKKKKKKHKNYNINT